MKSIIVVDDHPVVRLAVRNTFGGQDDCLFVGEASGPEEMMALIRQLPPDLVILDMMLGRNDGLTLIRKIRTIDPEIRVLVFSTRDDAVHVARARREGASGYVSKNAEPGVLLQAARSVLAGFLVFPETDGARGHEQIAVAPDICLSRRELSVLTLMAGGMRNKAIAERLYLSPKTISTYKARMQEKLGLASTLELIDYARFHGLG
ncbi:response regulator transcription factor [Paludibacterium paludis]|uniref:Transcriptional regulator n=1 Tax=Paludibacterium paludis TaxID=1225769 RepID=A0A918P3C2_9NEIS|nr:response regulator transcription factor [Paludibacterium paludis]GGY16514.1 putative transcriptional regulator [Paludibacterium paludis]